MKRINIYLTEEEIERLKALSEKTGLSVCELVRRAIDAFIQSKAVKAGLGRQG